MTAEAKAEKIDELCDQIEQKILRQVSAAGGFSINKIYTKKELMDALGIGEDAWKKMRDSGLKAATVANKLVISGAEVARWVEANAKEATR